jgi:hypothetical protein
VGEGEGTAGKGLGGEEQAGTVGRKRGGCTYITV